MKGLKWQSLQITGEGHYAILSAPWYLNYLKYGSDWVKFYNVDPLDFGGNSTQAEFVLGGEVRYYRDCKNKIRV